MGTVAGDRELSPATVDSPQSAAALLGEEGGLKGGPARARKLSAKKRSEIAKKAAAARWRDRKDG